MINSDKIKALIQEKGVYLLPNMCTLSSMFFGVYAVVMAVAAQYHDAAVAIFLALVMDGLDGRVARLTRTETDFGADLDSLSDVISFGVAPAITWYLWQLEDLGKFGIGLAFFYVATVALRLARFNNEKEEQKAFFKGLPCPAAAALLASLTWCAFADVLPFDLEATHYFYSSVLAALGFLMVSSFPYYSFKSVGDKGRVPFIALVGVVIVVAFFAWAPQLVAMVFFSLYALHGIILGLGRCCVRGQYDNDTTQ